jgi:zinc protease
MKYSHQILACLFLLLAPFVKIQAQDDADYRVVKSSNGQSFLLNNYGTGGNISTDIYFRMGPIYEFDSVSGISMLLSKLISAHIEAALKADGKQIQYNATIEPEQIAFHFESGAADLDYVLKLASDKIMHTKFDSEGLDEAKTEMKADIDSLKTDKAYQRETKVMKKIWNNDFKKLNPYGDKTTYVRITTEDLMAFHKRYFLPFNNTVSILGSFSDKQVLAKLRDAFRDFKSREFNPELITKVIDFKPVINTVQFISTGADQTLATVTYQNPGARQDREATYCAFVLTQMINDREGRIQKELREAGLKYIKAAYICNNFYGTFTISAQPSGTNYVDAFNRLSQLISDISKKDYFKEGEIEKAQKNIEIDYNNMKSTDLKRYMALVVRYRFSNDENYFTSFADSIKGVTVEQMNSYVNTYFNDIADTRDLMVQGNSSKTDSSGQQYFALDDSIGEIKFTYDLNKTDIETDEAKQNLQRVIQWLNINPDMHVQINGFSDEGEFVKSYDDSVLRFIDSTATFHKAMPDATKKGYLRIEFMRAMKIAKALYEAGISEDRISGTSMVFTSDTQEAAAGNRKCTLTFEKIHPRVSLYEYHFGKKKDEHDMSGK